MLEKLQKWVCRTVGSSLAASLEPLAHCWNVASLSLFYSYYFGRCLYELADIISLPCSHGKSTHCYNRLPDFSVTIPRCYKDVYFNSFFPCTGRLWNSLLAECFSLTYDLSGFNFRMKDSIKKVLVSITLVHEFFYCALNNFSSNLVHETIFCLSLKKAHILPFVSLLFFFSHCKLAVCCCVIGASAKWVDSFLVIFILIPIGTIGPGIEVSLNLTNFLVLCSLDC